VPLLVNRYCASSKYPELPSERTSVVKEYEIPAVAAYVNVKLIGLAKPTPVLTAPLPELQVPSSDVTL